MRIYRVRVLKPLEPRQRKHLVYLYRVGADSQQGAVAAVRKELDERFDSEGWQIVGCDDLCGVDRVVLDSIFTCTKERAADYVRDLAEAAKA